MSTTALVPENQAEGSHWSDDKVFIAELDRRYAAIESGEDKGVTLEEMIATIEDLRIRKYGQQ